MIGRRVLVIDYDTDGTSDDVIAVPQGGGGTCKACVTVDAISKSELGASVHDIALLQPGEPSGE